MPLAWSFNTSSVVGFAFSLFAVGWLNLWSDWHLLHFGRLNCCLHNICSMLPRSHQTQRQRSQKQQKPKWWAKSHNSKSKNLALPLEVHEKLLGKWWKLAVWQTSALYCYTCLQYGVHNLIMAFHLFSPCYTHTPFSELPAQLFRACCWPEGTVSSRPQQIWKGLVPRTNWIVESQKMMTLPIKMSTRTCLIEGHTLEFFYQTYPRHGKHAKIRPTWLFLILNTVAKLDLLHVSCWPIPIGHAFTGSSLMLSNLACGLAGSPNLSRRVKL